MKNIPVLAALFVVLLGVVFYASRTQAPQEVEVLSLPGWKTGEVTKVDDAGFSRIELKKGANTVVMVRAEGEGGWSIEEPVEGEAEGYRVRAILNLFEKDLRPTISRKIPEGKAGRYGLLGEDVISLKIYKRGSQPGAPDIDLMVGRGDSSEAAQGEMPQERTWLSSPALTTAHMVEGKRIRSAWDISMKELRSRKLLSIKNWSEIDRVSVERAGGENEEPTVVVRLPSKEGEEKPEKWRFESPADLELGDPRGWFSGLKGLTATEIIPVKEVGAEYGFGDPTKITKVVIQVEDAVASMRVGAEVKGDTWIRLDGKDREIYKVSPYTRKQLLKTAQDLRDKRILGIESKADVTGVSIQALGSPAVSLEKKGDAWQRVGDGAAVDAGAMGLLLNGLVNFRVSEFGDFAGEATGLEPAQLGVSVTLDSKGGRSETIFFGGEADAKFFARKGTGEVFKVSSHARKQLEKSWEDLKNKSVFDLEPQQARNVRIVRKGEAPLEFSREIVADAEGKTSPVWKLKSDPTRTAKPQQVEAILTAFARLKVTKTKTHKKPAEVGLGNGEGTRLEVTSAGRDAFAVHVSDERDDDAHYARAEGGLMGGGVFTISGTQAQKLVKTEADLLE